MSVIGETGLGADEGVLRSKGKNSPSSWLGLDRLSRPSSDPSRDSDDTSIPDDETLSQQHCAATPDLCSNSSGEDETTTDSDSSDDSFNFWFEVCHS